MTDKYADLRAALDAGPTPGPWTQGKTKEGRSCIWLGGQTEPLNDMGADSSWIDCNTEANAKLIAAANPDTIRALLAERDALHSIVEELVACDDLKKRIALTQQACIPESDEDFAEMDSLSGALAKRNPAAWSAARAALAQHQGEKR